MHIDTRLVAKVQAKAGALVHEANNVIQTYQSWVELYNAYEKKGWTEAKDNAEKRVHECEAKVRMFLAKLIKTEC